MRQKEILRGRLHQELATPGLRGTQDVYLLNAGSDSLMIETRLSSISLNQSEPKEEK
jgi:hypothetical protein